MGSQREWCRIQMSFHGGRLQYRKDEMAGEDLCRREGQWAARVERLHNVEQLHDIVRQRLTDVRSRRPLRSTSSWRFLVQQWRSRSLRDPIILMEAGSQRTRAENCATLQRELRNTTKNH